MARVKHRMRDAEEVGSRITEARKRAKLSVSELADRIGIHRSVMYRLEAGDVAPWAHLQDIAEAIGCDPGTLVLDAAKAS